MKKKKMIIGVICLSMVMTQMSFAWAAEENSEKQTVPGEQAQPTADELLRGKDYAKDQLLVTFKDGTSTRAIKSTVAAEDATCKDIVEVTDESRAAQVTIADDKSMKEAIEGFQENSKVSAVQPNYRYSVKKVDSFLADENSSSYQYQFSATHAMEAWDALTDAGKTNKTKVAVLDTGVDVYHKDLQATLVNTSTYTQTLGGEEIQTDEDTDAHGTHVSGIIGATYDNGIGGAGIASGRTNELIDLMVVGISEDGEYMYTADILEGLNYAESQGAKVINMSFGAAGRDRAWEAVCDKLYDDGIVLVGASGNEGNEDFESPGDFKSVIGVNATNKQGEAMYWSNYGSGKDISAPGNNIESTMPGDVYEPMSGTSMASPVVTGIVALVLDANPDLTPAQVYNIICASAKQSESVTGEFDEQYGYGIIDAKASVEAALNGSTTEAPSALYLKDKGVSLDQDDTCSLEALIYPATCLKQVTWTSDNPSVATVDSVTGQVTGIADGSTYIHAKVDGMDKRCMVSVYASQKATSIEILQKTEHSVLALGEYSTLEAKVSPSNVTNDEVYWTSSNRTIVDVDEAGGLTGRKMGKATITAKTYDGGCQDSFEVTVKQSSDDVKVLKKITKIRMGKTYTCKAEVLGADGTTDVAHRDISWSSTNPSIATISDGGVITPKTPGTTYIIAAAADTDNDEFLIVRKSWKLIVSKADYSGSDYGLKVSKRTYNSISLKWNRVVPATGYILQRATSKTGTYSTVKTLTGSTSTMYTDKGLLTGKAYYYRVRARYSPSILFSYSYKIGAVPSLATPTTSLTKKKGAITVKWTKVAGASGYTVYRAHSKNGSYSLIKRVSSGTVRSYTNTTVKKGKAYYYKVRAYRTVKGKRVYGKLSAPKYGIAI